MAGNTFDDLMSYLMGGTQLGNFLGVTSPTAATQAPLAVAPGTAPTAPAAGPMLGGLPAPHQGLLSGLLGGQAPVNPASYFQPRPGLLGDSPLGNMLRGAFAGPGAAAGTGGLTGFSNAFQGGSQAIQDRRKQEMAATLAGQQYQAGQTTQAANNLQIAQALHNYNLWNRGKPPLTYADLSDPQKLSLVMSAPSYPGQGQAGGQGTTGTATPTQGQQPAATAPAVALPDIANAIHMQESGGATGGPPSDVGATGGWQIMPDTFKSYAKPGEDINNPKDNAAVAQRIIADLAMKGGNDPGRIAVGYVSGPGNMAPPGSPTPWIKDFPVDPKNPNGPHVSDYVASINQRLGLPADGSQGQGQVAAGGTIPMQGQGGGQPDQLAAEFQQMTGFTPQEYFQMGAQMMPPNEGMMKLAQQYDANLITGTERAKGAGQNYRVTAGGELVSGDGRVIASNPTPTTMRDAAGNSIPALLYPNGMIVPAVAGAPGSGGATGGGTTGGGGTGQAGTAPAGGSPVQTPSTFSETQTRGWAEQLNEWGKSQKSSLVAENQMQTMATALTQTLSGAWATNKAEIADKLDAVIPGLGKKLLPNTDAAAVQIALRNQFAAAIGQVLPSVSTPAQEQLAQAQRSLADPNLSPDANRAIMGQVIGTLRWDRDMYHAASKALTKQPQDPNDFAIQWGQDHKLDDYITKATGELPVLKGQTTAPSQPAEDPAFRGLTNTHTDPKTGQRIGQDANGIWIDPIKKQKWDGLAGIWRPL